VSDTADYSKERASLLGVSLRLSSPLVSERERELRTGVTLRTGTGLTGLGKAGTLPTHHRDTEKDTERDTPLSQREFYQT
jgi:hypothetical protein